MELTNIESLANFLYQQIIKLTKSPKKGQPTPNAERKFIKESIPAELHGDMQYKELVANLAASIALERSKRLAAVLQTQEGEREGSVESVSVESASVQSIAVTNLNGKRPREDDIIGVDSENASRNGNALASP